MLHFRSLLILVAGLGLAALVAGCAGEGDTIVQTQGAPSGITVNGTGRVSGEPDIAILSLGVSVEGATVEAAREAAAQLQTAVINSVKGNGVDAKDVQTSNFSIQPQYDYTDRAPRIRGYTVTNTLSIKVRKLDTASKVIDDATRAGGNNVVVQGLSFQIDDPEELRGQARELAVRQAKQRADDLARHAGVSIGKPISIVEDTYSPVVAERSGIAAPATGLDTSTPIETGELDVVVNVTVLYKIN